MSHTLRKRGQFTISVLGASIAISMALVPFAHADRKRVLVPGAVIVLDSDWVDHHDGYSDIEVSGQLTEYRQRGPEPLVIKVPEHLKQLGDERAERRAMQFDAEGDKREFRFYRDNEAYDPRFPSIVFLRAPE